MALTPQRGVFGQCQVRVRPDLRPQVLVLSSGEDAHRASWPRARLQTLPFSVQSEIAFDARQTAAELSRGLRLTHPLPHRAHDPFS